MLLGKEVHPETSLVWGEEDYHKMSLEMWHKEDTQVVIS